MASKKEILTQSDSKPSVARARAGSQEPTKGGVANLKPIRDSARAKELGSKGGKKRQEQKNRAKTMREYAEAIMSARPNADLMKKIQAFCPEMATKDATLMLAAVIEQARRATEVGDTGALKYLGALMGQDPATNIDVKSDGKAINQCFAIVPHETTLAEWLKNANSTDNKHPEQTEE